MTAILTLVASDPARTDRALTSRHFQMLGLAAPSRWLADGRAAEISLPTPPRVDEWASWQALLADDRIDCFCTPAADRRKRLLVADMDATIVTTETLDELARHAGLYEHISAITERAMRGDLDFHAAIRERVALLKDLAQTALDTTLAETELTSGAEILVKTMAAHGAICVLVSGGFTLFTEPVAARAGFHHHHGNRLEMTDGRLTGIVQDPILDKDAKRAFLGDYQTKLGLTEAQTMAIGDGANDLPMLQAAGLGIGFHPKPLVRQAMRNNIIHGDLTAALYAQGFSGNEFVI